MIYTFEDLIFNKIPILDVNFFSSTAGGEEITDGSVVDILRTTISTWYVSIRNIVIVVLAFLLIYTGIRMAISTLPKEKAKYKERLTGWVKALIIVFAIHYVMYIVLAVNENLLSLIQSSMAGKATSEGWTENSFYATIQTRAYDVRLSVGIPGMILYIALFVTWLRFLWIYVKRLFTVLILVVIAPFIGAKYAFDSTSGKKSTAFSSWLYDYVMNVLIQCVHALVYVTIMSMALDLAETSISGFVIAIVFFNFIAQADKIVRDIFNFGRSRLVGDTAKQEGRKDIQKSLTGLVFAGQMASASYGLVKGTVSYGAKFGQKAYKKFGTAHPNIKENVDSSLNKLDKSLEEVLDVSDVSPDKRKGIMYDAQRAAYYNVKVRRLSRQNNSIGIKARKIKNSVSANRKKQFKSSYKFIKNYVVGVGSIVLAVPVSVMDIRVGAGMMSAGRKALKGNSQKADYSVPKYVYDENGNQKRNVKNLPKSLWNKTAIHKRRNAKSGADKKYTKKRDKNYTAIDTMEKIISKEDDIKEQMKDLNEREPAKVDNFKNTLNVFLIEASSSQLNKIISNYLVRNGITTIDNSTIDDIIEEVVGELNVQGALDDTSRKLIESASRTRLTIMKDNERKAAEAKATVTANVEQKAEENRSTSNEGNQNSQEPKAQNSANKDQKSTGSAQTKENRFTTQKTEPITQARTQTRQTKSTSSKPVATQSKVTFSTDDIVKAVQGAIGDKVVDKEFKDVTKNLFELDRQVNKFNKSAKTSYRSANKFLENL